MDENKLSILIGNYEREKRNLNDSIVYHRSTLNSLQNKVSTISLKLQILDSINTQGRNAISNDITDAIIRTNLRGIISQQSLYEMLRETGLKDLRVQTSDDFILLDPINNCEIGRGYDTIITFKV